DRAQPRRRRVQPLGETAADQFLTLRTLVAAAEVRTGTERPALGGEHGATDGRVPARLLERRDHLLDQRRGEEVVRWFLQFDHHHRARPYDSNCHRRGLRSRDKLTCLSCTLART